jgi:hypothetical protein
MDKVEEYINQKETLKAMANSRPSRDSLWKKKRKKGRSSGKLMGKSKGQ